MSIEDIYMGLIWLCLYMAPLALIVGSKRANGHEKTAWLLATTIFSWLALIAFYATVLSPKDRKARHLAKLKHQQLVEAHQAKQQELERQALQQATQEQTEQVTQEPSIEVPVTPHSNERDEV